jgi:TusA-related sulfurtransferase
VKTMYSLMDSSFNFPVRFKDEPAQQQAVLPKSKTPVYDLRGSPCPINYVKTKLKLEELPIGDILEVLLDEGAPIQNVPRSLQNDGQEIVEINKEQDFYRVIIKRNV